MTPRRPDGIEGRIHGPRNFGRPCKSHDGPPADVIDRARRWAESKASTSNGHAAWAESPRRIRTNAAAWTVDTRVESVQRTLATLENELRERIRRGRRRLARVLLLWGALWIASAAIGYTIPRGARIAEIALNGPVNGTDVLAFFAMGGLGIYILMGAMSGLGWTQAHGFFRFIVLVVPSFFLAHVILSPSIERIAAGVDMRHVVERVDGAIVVEKDAAAGTLRLTSPYWRGRFLDLKVTAAEMDRTPPGTMARVVSDESKGNRVRSTRVEFLVSGEHVVVEP